jgi:hypothetical protein
MSKKLLFSIHLAGLVCFVGLVLLSPHHLLYDEPFFVKYVKLLHQDGLTPKFLKSLTGTTGPLYAFVHYLFEPLTNMKPPDLRLVNVFLLFAVIATTGFSLKIKDYQYPALLSTAAIVIPTTWVMGGLALTEMPAIVLVSLSMYILIKQSSSIESSNAYLSLLSIIIGGAFLGLAAWGRQPYILLAGAPCLASLQQRKKLLYSLLYAGSACLVFLPLVIIWGGLVPPSHTFVQKGISFVNAIFSLAYAGASTFIVMPQFFSIVLCRLGIIVTASFVAFNLASGVFNLVPLKALVDRVLVSQTLVEIYSRLCGGMLLSFGALFLFALLRNIYLRRKDYVSSLILICLLIISLSPLFIAHQYSSRYTGMALPFILLAASEHYRVGWFTAVTAIIGIILGALSLHGYFS